MSTDLDSMVVFAHIVDRGGITAAARALAIPKSNVSRRLARLEHRLGVRLLERTTRKIHLTEVGEIYYRYCRRIVEEIEQAEHSVARSLALPRGRLRVSTSVTIGQHLVGPLLPEFIKSFPEVRVSLQLSNRRVDLIEEGFDLAIRVGRLEETSLISRRLGRSELGVYAGPEYLHKIAQPQVPSDLADLACIVMSHHESGHVWNLEGPLGTKSVPIQPRAIINDFAVIQQLLLEGVGIALLPHYVIRSPTASSQLIRVLPNWSVPFVELHAIYPSHRGATPKMRAFLDWLVKSLESTGV